MHPETPPTPAGGVSDTGSTPGGAGEPERTEGQPSSGGLLRSVKQKTTSQLNVQKGRATDRLDRMAQSVRSSTRQLRDERHGVLASMLERGADEIAHLASELRSRDFDDLVAELEAFGRRRPALFVGSSLALGVLLARFAKASSPPQPPAGRSYRSEGEGAPGRRGSGPGTVRGAGQEGL